MFVILRQLSTLRSEMNSNSNDDGTTKNESNLSTQHELRVVEKKTELRDLQNNNGVACDCKAGDSPLSKNRGRVLCCFPTLSDANRCSQEGHRHADVEPGSPKRQGISLKSWRIDPCEEAVLLHSTRQVKEEHRVSCFPAIAPMPLSSTICASGTPSLPPLHMGQLRTARFGAASHADHLPMVSTTIFQSSNLKGVGKLHWEERYHHLQILLRQLEDSEQEHYYMGMLRSLSSAELSRHAVELEKRSIQLSLEEAKEVRRVGIFNLLGKSSKK